MHVTHLRPRGSACYSKERVDHIILAQENCDEEVCNRHFSEVQGVGTANTCVDKNTEVDDENDTEQPAVEGHDLEAYVAEEVPLSFVGELVIEVTIPYWAALL